MNNCHKVWVNGGYAGGRNGGFLTTLLDITDLLDEGENTILVRADNSYDLRAAMPLWIGWNRYGGITRPIWLHVRNHSFIACAGVEIRTPQVSAELASTEVKTYIEETGISGTALEVRHTLIYRGAMDDAMLRDTIYPILRRAANYQIHRLEKRDGKYHAPVSHSPEYGDAPDANYELSMLRWACHALVAAGKRLKVKDAELGRYRDILENLTDYPTDETGFMVGRGVPFDRNHRHWCHLQMMHPLQLVTGKIPAERELATKSIDNYIRVNKGGGDYAPFQHTGVAAIWSLLGEGDKALSEIEGFMKHPVNCPNSMNHYGGKNPCLETPVYSAQNIHELLLQCYDEFPASGEMQATILVFPAVPDKWPGAIFHNLRTAGAFLVSAEHKDGCTRWVRVKSLAGEPCRIKPNLPGPARVSGKREFSLRDLGNGIYELDLKKGEEALLYSDNTLPDLFVAPFPAHAGKCNRYGRRSI
ncbi:hypothetical protein ES708_11738 [subsurface metagenome]